MSAAPPPFAPGQRVRVLVTDRVQGTWAAHCFGPVYMYLNLAAHEVTGQVQACVYVQAVEGWQVTWRPDGWPLPVGVWPGGLVMPAKSFALADGLVALGPLFYCDGANPFRVSVATVRMLTVYYLKHARDYIFETTTRAEALVNV